MVMSSVVAALAPDTQRVGNMTAAAHDELFEHAPPQWLPRRLGLISPGIPNIRRRALAVVLLGWAPLILLLTFQGTYSVNGLSTFLSEVGIHTRYLLAAPLLVLAETECAARLGGVIRHFVATGIVRENERSRFDAAVASTRRLLNAMPAEIIVVAVAYFVVVVTIQSTAPEHMPAWHRSNTFPLGLSPAGWWHVLVSLPLLLILFLGWTWRLLLWTRLLWLVSRLDLRLVASHPDHAAGLGFTGQSVRSFYIVALAISIVAAGASARLVLDGGGLPTHNLYFNIGLAVTILLVFTGPLAVFTPVLMNAWRTGTFAYGALADKVGVQFERKWLGKDEPVNGSTLERPDFSTTADLYQVLSNVYSIRFIPVDLKDVIVLATAVALPFVPLLFLVVPVSTIWQSIESLLF
jgi:hypothetical protein